MDEYDTLFHIYAIRNDITKDFMYVGCTTQKLGKRLYQHCHDERSAVHDAIMDCGEENISVVLITDYVGSIEEAHFLEEQYTRMCNENKKLFNKRFGDAHTEYTKAKLRKPRKQSWGVKNLIKHAGDK